MRHKLLKTGLIVSVALLFTFCAQGRKAAQTTLKPADIFTDHMVLQRQMPVPVWGEARPGTEVTVKINGQTKTARADQSGKWLVRLDPMKAGGPFTMTITGSGKTITLKDVLLGEVWLCSGQSNMTMPVKGWPPNATILNSAQEIEQAHYPEIRLFTVKRNVAVVPQDSLTGAWQPCTPQTVADFSATAYFFGRKLYRELHVPIGLIHSSWGGTPAEAWVEANCLSSLPQYRDVKTRLERIIPQEQRLKAWLGRLKKIDLSNIDKQTFWTQQKFNDQTFAAETLDDSTWPVMKLPKYWEDSALGQFDGVVWFRKEITLPEAWSGQDLQLSLGPIDDMDRVYFNGREVGQHLQPGLWQLKRVYTVPGKLVKKGKNVIAVLVIDTHGGGGLHGRFGQLKITPVNHQTSPLSLSGSWRYLPVAEIRGSTLYLFGADKQSYFSRPKLSLPLGSHTPTVLFNAMIHPLIPFAMRGVIWYQGESNVGRAKQYRALFTALINCWRRLWGQGDFPFYFVQIAPFDYGPHAHSELLREAQFKTLALKNTGMVVTTDIGNPQNVHPANKQAVGDRLALWALAKTYGRHGIVFSGPLYKGMKKEGNKIRLFFDYAASGLVARGGRLTNFIIAGKDRRFYPALAKIEDSTVVVWSPKVSDPQAVRFGWNNTAQPHLFNKAGLPASPFRTDHWPE